MRLIFIFLIGFLYSTTLYPQQIKDIIEQLPKLVKHEQDTYKTPSISIGIVKADSIAYLKTFGEGSDGQQYLIGSLSKSFTALTILKLQEKGLLSVKDKVTKYLPWFSYSNDIVSNQVTIEHLLYQTSGIRQRNADKKFKNGINIERFYEDIINNVHWDNKVGTEFYYSNLNYILLAFIAEKASGENLNKLIKSNITQVLNMNHTFSSYENVMGNNLIDSHQYFFYWPIIKKNIQFNNYELATGYISSTAKDMSTYLVELMESFNNKTNTNISEVITKSLFTPKSNIGSSYGMGWAIETWNDHKIFEHSGSTQSFNSYMFIMPELEIGVIILANSNYSGVEHIAYSIQRLLLNKPLKTYSKSNFYLKNSAPFLAIATLVLLIFMLTKWHLHNYQIRFTKSIKPIAFLIIASVIAIFLLIYVPIINNATLSSVIDYEPSIGYSLIIISIGIVMVSFIYYFIKSKSTLPNKELS